MYRKNVNELMEEFDSNVQKGLATSTIEERQEKYGWNQLQGKKHVSLFVRFISQFKDVLIIILLIAALVSIILDPEEWIESVIILVVVIINAILGVVQESKAEKSLEALKKMSSPHCKVLRDGVVSSIETMYLVPGDIILVEAGDFIPADARIIESANLQVDESALTGESLAVNKNNLVIVGEDVPLGDRINTIFSSTYVTNGKATAVVVATGMHTEIGKVADMLLSTENETTPLQKKLAQVGKWIGIIALGVCAIVFVMELISMGVENWIDAFKTAVALAVAAIPEGLATVVTVVLAIGVEKMSKENAIVKKLPAVETLGSTQIVCSDKTGTLTQNKMTVVSVFSDKLKDVKEVNDSEKELLRYFSLCCDAMITEEDGVIRRIGDPTELALLDANNAYGLDVTKYQRVGDLPFDSERKMMTVVYQINDSFVSITKGAPDVVASRSKNSTDKAIHANEEMASEALRVLGLGIKTFKTMPEVNDDLEKDLNFLGLVGMIDPARDEVKDAIAIAKKAGIRSIMITGDHVTTACAIARKLGILEEGQKAISTKELNELTDEQLAEHIEEYSVYARVTPRDKVRIVDAWKQKGKIVAMTGDGVNDAPALKKADIGCAMGITGTDVSKEAAEMILTDDNFATIISAVKQGRGIYANVKKCVKYLLSSNIGEVLTIFIASIISLFVKDLGVPLAAIHLLWVNLITDSLPAFGLGMEQPDSDVMDHKPIDKTEGFFAHGLGLKIALEGIMIGGLTLAAFLIGHYLLSTEGTRGIVGQTMAFLTLSTCQLVHSFNVKSDHTIFSKRTFNNRFLMFAFITGFVLQIGVIYIPGINGIFSLQPLNIAQFAICIGLALVTVVVMEISKLITNYKEKKTQNN